MSPSRRRRTDGQYNNNTWVYASGVRGWYMRSTRELQEVWVWKRADSAARADMSGTQESNQRVPNVRIYGAQSVAVSREPLSAIPWYLIFLLCEGVVRGIGM